MAEESKSLSLTPQEIQLRQQVSKVLLPLITRLQEAAYQNGPARFVHYTTAEGALGIIKSKRFWMRNATCMSDYREVQHGFSVINNYFNNPNRKGPFTEAVDLCGRGTTEEAIALFNRWWNDIQFNTYIAAMSEHDERENVHGRLSMWRAFGRSPARVGLVFKIPWQIPGVEALNLSFVPVAYLRGDEVDAMLREVMDNIHKNCDFLRTVDHQRLVSFVFEMFVLYVTCLKHEGFREEREWRALYLPSFRHSPFIESATEVIDGIPQRVYKIPLDGNAPPGLAELDFSRIFDHLIIGPSQYPWSMYEAFVDELTAAGVTGANEKVCASLIPIRT
jgi:hypothetical protein